jgi:hypothetical protein
VKHSGVWVGSTLTGEPVMEGLDYKDKLFFQKKRNEMLPQVLADFAHFLLKSSRTMSDENEL